VAPVEITLPWEGPAGELVTARLLFTSGRDNALTRSTFNSKSWHAAIEGIGMVQSRSTGFHALRHFYASTLLDAGESIKALATYLGHANPAFTLRVYTHFMKSSEERTREAIDAAFRAAYPEADGPETAPEVA
jgi:integrase